ncbi:MAG TPA: histidine--tRNA ligase [Burkholderiales bacterium]|jgi:histidyl-tRNA synthetase|nr:histidine--tRNA ligase [Burkholderiales bacterium]
MTQPIQAVRGMNDILPAESATWEFFEDTLRDWLAAYGYRNIRMPILEKTELFVRSIGETTDIVEKEMYTFIDQLNGESLTLRPEGTASCVRAAIQHNLLYAGPQRLYYSGPMFRHERPQKGRYRQFHQFGVEALGFSGPDVDAEHMVMGERLWKRLGLSDVRLRINTLGSSASRHRYRARLVKYLRSRFDELDEDSRRRLEHNPLRVLDSKNPAMQPVVAGAPRLLDDLDEESLKSFESLQRLLREAGVDFEIDSRLVRGLDYYNDAVYEWVTDRLGAQGTVCAGGRYDGLFEQIGGKPAPACGFALGVERLLALLAESGFCAPARLADIYLVHAGEAAGRFGWLVAERLRDAGLKVIFHCGGGSLKSQMKRADASGARFAAIIGDEEAAREMVSVKPLRVLGAQVQVKVEEVAALLRAAG